MFCDVIGKCPAGNWKEDEEWIWLQIEWFKKYIDFTCGKPILDTLYFVGACEEKDGGIITDEVLPNDSEGRQPRGIAVFYEDGAYEEYEPYYEKCCIAFEKLLKSVEWEHLNPLKLRKFFENYGYGEYRPKTSTEEGTNPQAKTSWTKLSDNLERICILPPMLAEKKSEWVWFILKLICSYIELSCGVTPSGCKVKYIHRYEEGWVGKKYKIWRNPIGIGLCWSERREEKFAAYLEKCRIAFGTLFSNINWRAIDGFELQQYFETNGYDKYLDKY